MPIELSLPFPDPQQNLRIGWPRQGSGLQVGGPFDTGGFVGDFQIPVAWLASIGAGANTMDLQDDILCARFTSTVQRTFIPFAIIKPRVGDLNAGLGMPEQQRIYRARWLMRMDVPALDRASGVSFSPATVLTPSFTQAGQPAFGITGDSAATGAWEYNQSNVGAFPANITASEVISSSVVPDATDWSLFDIELINSAPGRAASMSLFINNIFVLSKSWTTFSPPDTDSLPLLSTIVSANKFVWTARAATAGAVFFMGPVIVDMGRFTRAGLELQS